MPDAVTMCMLPGCTNSKSPDHAMCGTHWGRLPADVREAFWATRPHSNERRYQLMQVFRFALRNKPVMAGLKAGPGGE